MSSPSSLGPSIIGIGIAVVLIGLLVWTGALNWFGRLPGDIHIDRDNVHVYVPIVSMLVISVVLNVILRLLSRAR
jgi:DUF2905 family protein